jgi:predicted  nucleic acid-binding Zn-ribbon protein
MRFILAGIACVGLCAGGARAEGANDLNDLMALRAKVMVEAHQLQVEIRQAWDDPKHTSPEIELLRKKIQDLQDAILYTQADIRSRVEKLPEVQGKVKKVEAARKQVEELNQKIEKKLGTN